MPTVDELFAAYRAAYPADPAPFLERLEGADRRELAALIEAFVSRAPAPAYDDAAFTAFAAEPLTRRIQGEIGARMTETWATLLPAERERAQLEPATLVARLARALGVTGREAKVAMYYGRMEAGTLPGHGVSDRVLEALGQIIDVPAARLRAAGERLAPPAMFAAPASMPMPARAARAPLPRKSRWGRTKRRDDGVGELRAAGSPPDDAAQRPAAPAPDDAAQRPAAPAPDAAAERAAAHPPAGATSRDEIDILFTGGR